MPRWDRASWAGLSPNGIGQVKPNHYVEMAKTIWRNKDELPFAWRILTRGVCDGCVVQPASATSRWTESICAGQARPLRLNTMPALDVKRLEDLLPLTKCRWRAPSAWRFAYR